MYCVKCGVELADSEKKCPLCGTVVYHPYVKQVNAEKPYPEFTRSQETVNPKGLLFILTVFFALALIITVLCDLNINSTVTWSGYAGLGIVLGYAVIALPLWFKRPNPVIFVPIDFALAAGLLLYIDLYTDGYWFMTLAFPVVGMIAVIATTVIALVKYVKKGFLFIFGGAFIAVGGAAMLTEFFLNLTFDLHQTFIWSLYPMVTCVFIGMMLIVIGVCRPLRESLHKKFFI